MKYSGSRCTAYRVSSNPVCPMQ